MLLGVFALLCIAIATLGQYAVAAFSVSRRTRDYGVRKAFGASANQILIGVLREGLMVTAVGLCAGLLLSGVVATVLANAFFGIRALDPVTYSGVLLMVAATTLVAYLVPAIRATRVQPAIALRHE
jgi:putative ABC transport system permease protein